MIKNESLMKESERRMFGLGIGDCGLAMADCGRVPRETNENRPASIAGKRSIIEERVPKERLKSHSLFSRPYGTPSNLINLYRQFLPAYFHLPYRAIFGYAAM